MGIDLPELREHIRARRAALAGFMEQGATLALDGEVLRVFPQNDIYIRYLNEQRASIAELASEWCGRKLRVEVSLNGAGTAQTDPAAEGATAQSANNNGDDPESATVESDRPDDGKTNRESADENPKASAESRRITSNVEWRAWGERVASAALQRCPAILHDWLPGGRVNGREFEAGDFNGTPGHSLKVNLDSGKWKDFASSEPGGGNLVSLYARTRNLEYRDAQRELSEQFNIERPKRLKSVTDAWEAITPIPDFAPRDETGQPVLPELPTRCAGGEVTGIWLYRDRDGQALIYRIRINLPNGSKDVLPLSFARNRETGEMRWRWKDLPSPRPLYGLELLVNKPDAPVLIVEGEKTCDAARRLLPEWRVVTWAGGSARASSKHTDWSPILNRGGRKVIFPDADKPGTKAAAVIAEVLGKCAIVQPDPAWPEGWDLADAEAQGWDTARVLNYLESHLIIPQEKPAEPRVEVNISNGDLHEQSMAVWRGVSQVNDRPGLLASAAGLTLVDRDPIEHRARRRIAKPETLRQWLAARLAFKKYSSDGGTVGAKPSDALIQNLLAFPHPPLPFLRRVTEVPVLAADGRLIAAEGFDTHSGIYYLPHPILGDLEFDPNPPTPDEIKSARALIDDLIFDFPFVKKCDRAHTYSFMLLPIIRDMIDGPTPLHRFEAPQPRTGKSLLMRLAARITCNAISDLTAPEDEDEWRKRITSVMSEGPEAFLIDNATALESGQLAKLLTDVTWEDRRLGGNEQVRYPVRCAFGATLNNPVLSREILGRSLRIRLDAKNAHPEQRTKFRHPNVLEYARENRAALVGALVTLVGAATGSDPDAPILGGYESFCRRMSAILKAIGVQGFLLDRGDISSLPAAESALLALVNAWGDRYGGDKVEISNLLDIAKDTDGLPLGRTDNENSQRTALGKLLRRYRGYTVGGWRLSDPVEGRHTRWHLIPVNPAGPGIDDTTNDEDEFEVGE